MENFATVADYLHALSTDSTLSVVSMAMAAKSREVSRAAIERMLKIGTISGVRIDGTQCVFAKDLIEADKRKQAQIDNVRRILEECAESRRTVFYEQVMSPIGLSTRVPAHRTFIGQILDEISSKTYEESGVLLSVLVHKKTVGKTSPSDGFFKLAYRLGYESIDSSDFVKTQTEQVFKLYKKLGEGNLLKLFRQVAGGERDGS